VIIDAVRCAKLALDRGMSGSLTAPSSYFMKTPPIQYTDDMARELMEEFIRGESTAEAELAPPAEVIAAVSE
jgi:myo-inositol-1-phosphate synthase